MSIKLTDSGHKKLDVSLGTILDAYTGDTVTERQATQSELKSLCSAWLNEMLFNS